MNMFFRVQLICALFWFALSLTACGKGFSPSAGSTEQASAIPEGSTPATPSPTPGPSPSPTPNPSNGFPNASNTGVPAGVTLTDYAGPMNITVAGTTIDAKTIRGTLTISAKNVTIQRSKIIGNIDADDTGNISVMILDSEIDGGTSSAPAVGYGDITMARVNVHGSRVSVLCGTNCNIQDSWLHDQYLLPGSDWHVNGYISNGGSNVLVKHNTIACDTPDNGSGGGCTGPAASFGDFAPLNNITYDGNLFVASPGGYCLSAGWNASKPYGNNPSAIVVQNNVFQRGTNKKCGAYGPATSFLPSGIGNVWLNNTWDDGSPQNSY